MNFKKVVLLSVLSLTVVFGAFASRANGNNRNSDSNYGERSFHLEESEHKNYSSRDGEKRNLRENRNIQKNEMLKENQHSADCDCDEEGVNHEREYKNRDNNLPSYIVKLEDGRYFDTRENKIVDSKSYLSKRESGSRNFKNRK